MIIITKEIWCEDQILFSEYKKIIDILVSEGWEIAYHHLNLKVNDSLIYSVWILDRVFKFE